MTTKKKAAILGSGNIGTDLLVKLLRTSRVLEPFALVGIDRDSDGLAFARRHDVVAIDTGIDGLLAHPGFVDVDVVFDATSAKAHLAHAPRLQGKRVVDLTPAAVGPYAVPVVNLAEHKRAPNVNMVTCGGQATIPIVHAVSRVAKVRWAEIVAAIASKSAGPGTRANIDEFTVTTARGIEVLGGAARGKAIIILNPAEPPLIMRDTVHCLCEGGDEDAIARSIRAVVEEVRGYVPGYRLLKDPVFQRVHAAPPDEAPFDALQVTTFLEVEGAGHYLPKYAGNLDIMTSAALRMGEEMAQ